MSTVNLKSDVITDRDRLERIAEQWDAILEDSKAQTIFLTWEWVSAWLDAVQPDARLLVVTARERGGRLVAIAPFYRTRMRLLGLVPYRCLRVIGDCDSGAEYPDVIIRRGFEDEAMSSVLAALLEHRDMWDCVWLPNVAGWTEAFERFQRGCALSALHLHERTRDFATAALPDSYGAYLKSLSANARSSIRRRTRRLLAASRVELVRCESEDQLSPLLESLFDLHAQRWAMEGRVGSFACSPRQACFYKRFGRSALERGWLRLFALRVDGVIQSVQYGYVYRGIFHQLQEGFSPSAMPGIGNVLRGMVIEECIAEGLRVYDFLGEFTEHKRRWGAKRREGYDLFLGRRRLKNRLLFTRPVWPTGRYVRETAQS